MLLTDCYEANNETQPKLSYVMLIKSTRLLCWKESKHRH